jgi:hypothetical protein
MRMQRTSGGGTSLRRLGLPAKTLEATSAEIAPIPDALTAR